MKKQLIKNIKAMFGVRFGLLVVAFWWGGVAVGIGQDDNKEVVTIKPVTNGQKFFFNPKDKANQKQYTSDLLKKKQSVRLSVITKPLNPQDTASYILSITMNNTSGNGKFNYSYVKGVAFPTPGEHKLKPGEQIQIVFSFTENSKEEANATAIVTIKRGDKEVKKVKCILKGEAASEPPIPPKKEEKSEIVFLDSANKPIKNLKVIKTNTFKFQIKNNGKKQGNVKVERKPNATLLIRMNGDSLSKSFIKDIVKTQPKSIEITFNKNDTIITFIDEDNQQTNRLKIIYQPDTTKQLPPKPVTPTTRNKKPSIQILDSILQFSTFQQTTTLRVAVNELPPGQTVILKLDTISGKGALFNFTKQELIFTKADTQAFQVKLKLPLGLWYNLEASQEGFVVSQGLANPKVLKTILIKGAEVYHWQLIGLIGLAILIVGIVLFILWRKRKNKKLDEEGGDNGNEKDTSKKPNTTKQNEALAEALKLFRELDFETKQKTRQQLQETKTKELKEGNTHKVYQAYKQLDKKGKSDFLIHTKELHNLEDFFEAIRKKMNVKSSEKAVEKLLQKDLPQLLTEELSLEDKLSLEKQLLAEVDHISTEDAKLLALLNFTTIEQQALVSLKVKNYQEFLKGFAQHFNYDEKHTFYQAIQPEEISSVHLVNPVFQKAGDNYYVLFWCLKNGKDQGQANFKKLFNTPEDNLRATWFQPVEEIQAGLCKYLSSDQRVKASLFAKSKALGESKQTEAYWLWERYKLLSHQEQTQLRETIQNITLEKFWGAYNHLPHSPKEPNEFIKSFSEPAYAQTSLKVTYYDKFTTADQTIIRLTLLRQSYCQFSFAHKNIFYTYLTKGKIDLTQEAFFKPYQGLYLADDSTHQQNLKEWHQLTIAPGDLLDACKDLPSLGELETNQNYETQFRQFSLLSNEERKEFEALFEKEPDPGFTEEEFKDLQKRNAALENEVRNLQTQLKAKEPLTVVEDQGLKQENERLQTALKELQHKNASLAGLENQQSMWTNEKTRLENDLQALKDAKSQTDQELGRLRALEQTLNTSKTELDQQVLALQTQINKQDQQLQQLTTLEEEKEKLNGLNNELTDEKQVLAQNLANTEKELEKIGAELASQKDNYEEKIAALEHTLEENGTTFLDLQNDYKKLKEAKDQLETDLVQIDEKLNTERSNRSERIKEINDDLASLKIDAYNREERIKVLHLGELAYQDLSANYVAYKEEGTPPPFITHMYYALDNAYNRLKKVYEDTKSESKFKKLFELALFKTTDRAERVDAPIFGIVRKSEPFTTLLGIDNMQQINEGEHKEIFLKKFIRIEAKTLLNSLALLHCYGQVTHPSLNLQQVFENDGIDQGEIKDALEVMQRVLKEQFDTEILYPELMKHKDDPSLFTNHDLAKYDEAPVGNLNQWFKDSTQNIEPDIVFDFTRIGFYSEEYPFMNNVKPAIVVKA